MADGRNRSEWSRTSSLMAAIMNAAPGGRRRAVQPQQFNPYAQRNRKSQDKGYLKLTREQSNVVLKMLVNTRPT